MRASWKLGQRRRRKQRRIRLCKQRAACRPLYEPLPNNTCIRLVTIEPGAFRDPIRCTLEVFELSQAPQYEAISYVWGNPTPRNRIRCSGKRFLVSDHLGNALRNVRKTDAARIIWVDALAIDQSNMAERSGQVLLMKDIYAKATKTLICLDSDDSKAADEVSWTFSAYLAVIKFAGFCEISDWDPRHAMRPWYEQTPLPSFGADDKVLINRLFSSKWFQRVWVIQEIIMSNEPVFVLGQIEWDWHFFGVVAWRFLNSHKHVIELNGDAGRGAWQASQMWFWRRNRRQNGINQWLWDVMDCFRLPKATDPRDLIYGLLGISNEINLNEQHSSTTSTVRPPLPNYRDSLLDVYTDWARYFIESHKCLDVFSQVSMPGAVSSSDMPSWIPHCDFDTPDEVPWTAIEASFPSWVPHWNRLILTALRESRLKGPHYQASRALPVRLNSTRNRYAITPRGLNFDIVKWVGKVMYKADYYPGYGSRTNDHAIIRNYLTVSKMLECYPNGGTVHNAYAMAAAAGHVQPKPSEGKSSPGFDMLMYCAWLTASMNKGHGEILETLNDMKSTQNIGWSKSYEEFVLGKCIYRRLFITEKGYLGLGPSGTEIGNLVCILFGGDTPYILRRNIDHYNLIGECYLHGMMQGEAIGQMEAGELTEEWFEIR